MDKAITKKLNAVITNSMIRIEIPLPTLRKLLGYQKKEIDKKKGILDEVRGMWVDRKGIDALAYQKKLRREWK